MEKFLTKHFEEIKNISGLKVSPDGRHAVYAVSHTDFESDGNFSSINIIDLETRTDRPLTSGKGDSAPFWLDDETVVFSAMRDPADKEKAGSGKLSTFYKISINGGEAEKFMSIPAKAAAIHKLPCGNWLVSATCDLNPEGEGKQKEWTVYDEYPYHFNGKGFVNKIRRSLFLWKNDTAELKLLTEPLMQVNENDPSVIQFDEEGFFYTGLNYDVESGRIANIYKHVWKTGENKAIWTSDVFGINTFFLHGDKIYFVGSHQEESPLISSHAVCCVNKDGSDFKVLCSPEFAIGAVKLVRDDFWFVKTVKSRASVCRWTIGTPEDKVIYNGDVNITDIQIAGGRCIVLGRKNNEMPEVYEVNNGIERLSHQNDPLFEKYTFSAPVPMSVMDNGYEICGWVIKPVGFEDGKKYPGILYIHGGPHGMFGDAFNKEMQRFANEGYFVFFCNPRGSVSYGVDFMNVTGACGTYDFENLMAFTDGVIANYPELDADRLACTGGSYGGYMSNWIIGHTDRFKAAVPRVSISNWVSMHGCSDIKWYGDNVNMSSPWRNIEKLWFHSPLKYADNVKTPTLLIQHDQDFRCPIEQAEQMLTALLERRVPAKMIVNHGASHGVKKPSQDANDIVMMLKWFEKYV